MTYITKVIKIPKSVNVDIDDLSTILYQYNSIYCEIDSAIENIELLEPIRVIFDFSDCVFFKSELITFIQTMASKLNQIGCSKITFTNMSPGINKIFLRNGIFNKDKQNIPINNLDTVIPLYANYSNDIKSISSYLSNHVIRNNYWPDHLSSKLGIEVINSAISEIVDNTFQHSGSNLISMCGQFYPRMNTLGFTITDAGVGIPVNLKNHSIIKSDKKNDSELINWATKKGNSTKNIPASGLGLFDIKDNLKNNGSLTIISNSGFWKMHQDGEIQQETMRANFKGTMIHLNFLLDNVSEAEDSFELPYNDYEDNINF